MDGGGGGREPLTEASLFLLDHPTKNPVNMEIEMIAADATT